MASLNIDTLFKYNPAQKTEANVLTRREKNGQCANCGMKTHRIEKDFLGGTKRRVPLTKKGKVLEGRCLLCKPLPIVKEAIQAFKVILYLLSVLGIILILHHKLTAKSKNPMMEFIRIILRKFDFEMME